MAILKREHVLDVLKRWQAGDLTNEEVEGWAQLVEVRDDLDHYSADPAVIEAVFDLANPFLRGPLELVGQKLLAKLRLRSDFHPNLPLAIMSAFDPLRTSVVV